MHDLFGDESCGAEIVTYGFVLVPETFVSAVSNILSEVKKEFSSSELDLELHCSRIFGPTARSKSEWAHLSIDDVFSLYTKIITLTSALPIRKIAVSAARADWPNEISGGPWVHKDPHFVGPLGWAKGFQLGEKHIAAFCGKIGLTELAKTFDLRNVRFWADPDTTPISLGNQNRQASRVVTGPISGQNGWGQIQVMEIKNKKPDLLQVADAVAFISRRFAEIKGRSPNDERFRRLFRALNPEVIPLKMTAQHEHDAI